MEEKLVEAEPSARSSDIINEGREAILDIGRSSINHQPNHKETNIIITRSHAGHQRYDRKRKICDWQKEDFSMYKAFKALKEASVSNEKDNEFTTFGKSVGQQLQQMPLVDALELQMQIQNMITLRRLKLLRAKAARSPSVQSISCNSGSASIDSSHYDDNDLGEEISVYPDVFNNVDKWKEK